MAKYKMSTIESVDTVAQVARLACGHENHNWREWYASGIKVKCAQCSAQNAPQVAREIVPNRPFAVPVYTLRMVRESTRTVEYPQIRTPHDSYVLFRDWIADVPHEMLAVVALDTKNRVIGTYIAGQGTLNAALVTMRETFKTAIIMNACSIMVAHNHPSGDPTPSPEDVRMTEALVESGKLLDIPVLDHIILGDTRYAHTRYVSMRERKLGFK